MHVYLVPATTSVANPVFVCWQGVAGATSWPLRTTVYQAQTAPNTVPGQETMYPLIDGAITAMDPAELVVPYLIERRREKRERIAVLSIGTASVLNATVGGDEFPVESVNWITAPSQSVASAWSSNLANRHLSAPRIESLVRLQAARWMNASTAACNAVDMSGTSVGWQCRAAHRSADHDEHGGRGQLRHYHPRPKRVLQCAIGRLHNLRLCGGMYYGFMCPNAGMPRAQCRHAPVWCVPLFPCGHIHVATYIAFCEQAVQSTSGDFYPDYTMIGARWADAFFQDIQVWVRNYLVR
eukprot:351375-Chlamydomonas_euryale.AAC.7